MQRLTIKSFTLIAICFILFGASQYAQAQTINLLAHFELEGAIYLPYDDHKDQGLMKVELEINNVKISTGEIKISGLETSYVSADGVLSSPSTASGWNTVSQSFTMPFSLTLNKKTRFEVNFALSNRNSVKLLFSDSLGYTQAASGLTLTKITLANGTSLASAGYEFNLDSNYTQVISDCTEESTIYKDSQYYPNSSSVTETSIKAAASLTCNGTNYLFNFQASPKESHTHTINHAKSRLYSRTSNCTLTKIVK